MDMRVVSKEGRTRGEFRVWRTTATRSSLLAAIAGIAFAASVAAASDARSWWMETHLGGVPTGYLHEKVDIADGERRTEQVSQFVLNRMGSRVEVRSHARYREDAQGVLQEVVAEVGSSAETTTSEGKVVEGVLRVRTRAGGRDYTTDTPLAEPLLGPQGLRERSRDALRKPGDTLRYLTYAGDYASLAKVERVVTGVETLEIEGRRVESIVVRETTDVMPVPTQLWLDGDGRALRTQQQSPFGTIDNRRTDAGVRERVAAGAELPESTYENAVAKSNVRLPRPRSLDSVRVRIELKRDDVAMPVFDGPDQRVVERSDRHAVLEMRRAAEPKPFPTGTEGGEGREWLAPNAYLQSDHPEVVALARSLRKPGLDAYRQARVLQDWVATQMTFDAGIALVSASEAVRDRRGTCLAYAVVLSTLARALDIPSRVVMGHVYAANMWGGHAWSEVLVDGRWIALDAAVWRAGPADPARIGVIRTSLEHGASSGLASLASLYGNERVRVLGYTVDGTETTVAADAAPYVVDGREYRNDALGLRLRAPEGFAFAELDIMYPRSDVVVLRGDDGTEVKVQQRSARPGEVEAPLEALRSLLDGAKDMKEAAGIDMGGTHAQMLEAGRAAAAVWVDDSDLWVVRGEGSGAGRAVRDTVAGLRIGPKAK